MASFGFVLLSLYAAGANGLREEGMKEEGISSIATMTNHFEMDASETEATMNNHFEKVMSEAEASLLETNQDYDNPAETDVFFGFMDGEALHMMTNVLSMRYPVKNGRAANKVPVNYGAVYAIERKHLSETGALWEHPMWFYKQYMDRGSAIQLTNVGGTVRDPEGNPKFEDDTEFNNLAKGLSATVSSAAFQREGIKLILPDTPMKIDLTKGTVPLTLLRMGPTLYTSYPRRAIVVRLPEMGKQASLVFEYIKGIMKGLKHAGFDRINAYVIACGGAAWGSMPPGTMEYEQASVFVGVRKVASDSNSGIIPEISYAGTTQTTGNYGRRVITKIEEKATNKEGVIYTKAAQPDVEDAEHDIRLMFENMEDVTFEAGETGLTIRASDGEVQDVKTGSPAATHNVAKGWKIKAIATEKKNDGSHWKPVPYQAGMIKGLPLDGKWTVAAETRVTFAKEDGSNEYERFRKLYTSNQEGFQEYLRDLTSWSQDLTTAPTGSGSDEKGAAVRARITGVNMEDYWFFKTFIELDKNAGRDYPILHDRFVARVQADPGHGKITVDGDVHHIQSWMKLDKTRFVKRTDFMEMIRFAFRGFPFIEETRKKSSCMYWTWPKYLAQKLHKTFNGEFVRSRFVVMDVTNPFGDHYPYFVLDPFAMEVAQDFLNNLGRLEIVDVTTGQSSCLGSLEAANSDECTTFLRRVVDDAAILMWERARNLKIERESPEDYPKDQYIPMWVRMDKFQAGVLGVDLLDLPTVDLRYYKSGNNPALMKMNEVIFQDKDASTGSRALKENIVWGLKKQDQTWTRDLEKEIAEFERKRSTVHSGLFPKLGDGGCRDTTGSWSVDYDKSGPRDSQAECQASCGDECPGYSWSLLGQYCIVYEGGPYTRSYNSDFLGWPDWHCYVMKREPDRLERTASSPI